MGVIRLLDDEVSQLIAAGEVVERPSSVVKELVENSIDAGASKITVEIRHGGVTQIRVSDNGSGIQPDDVKMMFLRHATSKVRTQEDLTHIATLGFRGEAMASIHAVSRMEVITRTHGSDEGVCYRGEGAQIGEVVPAGCPEGTTIRVADLFYNTPARMKFLKKDVQEGNSVAGVVERIALSHPEISFQLIREGQTKLHTPGDGRLLSAIHAVYGKEFTQNLAQVEYAQGNISVSGFVPLPSASRSNRTMQTFFVNGRYVKSVTARTALEEAFKHSIMVGKFPACVLNLSIPFTETDINVHPAKIEVRFTNERPVFDAVYYGVKSALSKQDKMPLPAAQQNGKKTMTVFDLQRQPQIEQIKLTQQEPRTAQGKQSGLKNLPDRMSAEQYRSFFREDDGKKEETGRLTFCDLLPEQVKREREQPVILREEPRFSEYNAKRSLGTDNLKTDWVEKCETKPQRSTQKTQKEETISPAAEVTLKQQAEQTFRQKTQQEKNIESAREIEKSQESPEQFRLLGEIMGTYLVAEGKDRLILIDKHAAHERLIFNRLKKQDFTGERQLLLEPIMVHLSREDYQGAAQSISLFEQAGFLVEDFGDGDLMVREVPVLLSGAQIQEIVEQTAHSLSKNKKDLTPQALDELLHSVACKSAVRANDKNAMPELYEIVELLREDEDAKYCPHGRPIARTITKREIERMFGRLG